MRQYAPENDSPFYMKPVIQSLPLMKQGKVRDVYVADSRHIVIVASDRLSAFDVVLPDTMPGKGAILTALSNFWFEKTRTLIRNHLTDMTIDDILPGTEINNDLRTRSVVAKKLTPLPFEAIVRGYLIGSAWKDYQRSGRLCGIDLPQDLKLAQKLPRLLFTPSSKAAAHEHDTNISFPALTNRIGQERAEQVREVSLRIYRSAAEYALARGIIIADTKFEFGTDEDGELVLMDEVLTPDSSRFWSSEAYRPGSSPSNFDKQFIRDYLETLNWDKCAPGPRLPPEIIRQAVHRYQRVKAMLLDDGG